MNEQTALATINQGFDFSAIDRADLQPSTREKYKTEIKRLLEAGVSPMNYKALQAYADGLKSSRKSFLKAGLRILSLDYERELKAGALDKSKSFEDIQRKSMALEAMRDAVIVPTVKGEKTHTWLSPVEVEKITRLCGDSIIGKRDWIILSTLLGAGLRREELANMKFSDLKQQPMEDGKMRDVISVIGKGAKKRTIPIKPLLGQRLREWQQLAGGEYVARSMVRKSKTKINGRMSAVAIFQLVSKYGDRIGRPGLAPHDLRRTFAQLGYNAGVPITQISILLGHSSVETTQRYLNLKLNLESTASDFIPLAE